MSDAAKDGKRKVATNLSVRAELVREAKAAGVNLSEVFEAALRDVIRCKREEAWREENRGAIEAYNTTVERAGGFGDDWRKL